MPGRARTGPEGPRKTIGEPAGERLPVSHRLRSRGDIKRVQDGGRRFAVGPLLLMVSPNPLGYRRLGVTVSSRVGNSVTRNRVKRWFREIFRRRRGLLPPSMDVVMIARAAAARAGLAQLTADFEKAAGQARQHWERRTAAKSPDERDGR